MNTWLAVLWKLLAIIHRQVPSHAEAGDGCWEEGRAGGSRGVGAHRRRTQAFRQVCVCT